MNKMATRGVINEIKYSPYYACVTPYDSSRLLFELTTSPRDLKYYNALYNLIGPRDDYIRIIYLHLLSFQYYPVVIEQ